MIGLTVVALAVIPALSVVLVAALTVALVQLDARKARRLALTIGTLTAGTVALALTLSATSSVSAILNL